MRVTVFAAVAATMVALSAANAAEYLTEVDSEVFQTTGTQAQITERGASCIAQYVKPGNTATQLIISKDAVAGIIVANNGLSYTTGLVNWPVRTTFTFEAKDGRFRMRHTAIERFGNSWQPIGKWTGSPWTNGPVRHGKVQKRLSNPFRQPSRNACKVRRNHQTGNE